MSRSANIVVTPTECIRLLGRPFVVLQTMRRARGCYRRFVGDLNSGAAIRHSRISRPSGEVVLVGRASPSLKDVTKISLALRQRDSPPNPYPPTPRSVTIQRQRIITLMRHLREWPMRGLNAAATFPAREQSSFHSSRERVAPIGNVLPDVR